MAVVNHMDQWGPIFRSETTTGYAEHNNLMEKRQLFLRSYQFCRKRSVAERIKKSLVRVKGVIWFRLRSARKFRKLVWSRLRLGFSYRRRRFLRLVSTTPHHMTSNALDWPSSSSSCFW
ncbi:hypothetical protein L1049_019436 [Liquidambar formosana]|uniref:Uncharacterized protein n=1 Tax=Liquidambar formosana TaxID=63359 RepID=A0AAP0X985_LIQFO